jgi:DsbC/DsbD-like thiol-disulfide interchange protein
LKKPQFRIDTYKATAPENPLAYLAVLRIADGCSMHFFGPTALKAASAAQAWFDAEVAKEKAKAERAAERAAKRKA